MVKLRFTYQLDSRDRMKLLNPGLPLFDRQ